MNNIDFSNLIKADFTELRLLLDDILQRLEILEDEVKKLKEKE